MLCHSANLLTYSAWNILNQPEVLKILNLPEVLPEVELQLFPARGGWGPLPPRQLHLYIGVPGSFFRGGQQFLSAKTQSCSVKKISKPNKNGYKQTNLAEKFIKYGGKGLCWPCFVSALSAFQFFSAKLTISFLPSHPILFCQAKYFCQGGPRPPRPPPRNAYEVRKVYVRGGV